MKRGRGGEEDRTGEVEVRRKPGRREEPKGGDKGEGEMRGEEEVRRKRGEED